MKIATLPGLLISVLIVLATLRWLRGRSAQRAGTQPRGKDGGGGATGHHTTVTGNRPDSVRDDASHNSRSGDGGRD